MVSFLGLRFGSDKKKLQHKQQEAEKSAKKWGRNRKDSTGSGQSFGHVLPRPQRPLSRPGSGYSNRSTIFRAPFSQAEATSSMVDLAPPSPRKSSGASLRHAVSSSNLRNSRPVISGPLSPPVPLPLSNTEPGKLGDLTRPGTAGSMKKDWVNPLDVHFGKDMDPGRPHTSSGPSTARSPLGRFDFDIGDQAARKGSLGSLRARAAEDSGGPNGYPSPPTSVKSVEQAITRTNTDPRGQQSAKPTPSSLRRVNTADPAGLPSPATSEERADTPVIRNIHAKRDTMTFHSPRRRSFTKQVHEGVPRRQARGKSEQEKLELKKRRQTEGFEGNFAAFNFGAAPFDASIPLPSDRPVSPMSVGDSNSPSTQRVSPRTSQPRTTQESGKEGPASIEEARQESQIEDDYQEISDLDSITAPSLQGSHIGDTSSGSTDISQGGNGTPSVDSFTKPPRPRVDSDTRGPATPTALRAPPPINDRATAGSQSPRRQSISTSTIDDVPPPRLDPDGRSQSPLRSRPPIEGDFPVSKGLPRGRRPDSIASRRGRSPAGLEDIPVPKIDPDRRSQSPLSARRPIEGNFPVTKGLPRGRRPGPAPAPIAPAPYVPAPPRPPRESEGITATPGWATRSEKHLSAMPAPLSPLSGRNTFNDGSNTPTSLIPPRLPSPTFTSLEESMTENLSKAFDQVSFGETLQEVNKPLISPVLSEFGGRNGNGRSSPMRVEAKKAPPRPSPMTLPPSKSGTPDSSIKSPTTGEFSPGFI